MADAFLVGGVRTPVGRYGGVLSSVRPDDLLALTMKEAVSRAGIDPSDIDEVLIGNTNQAGEDNRNVARQAILLAGFPDEVPGMTVNRLCASGLSAIMLATHMVQLGEADIVIAGGVESMSRAPWVMAKPEKAFAKPGEIADTSIGSRFVNPKLATERPGASWAMTQTAEELASRDGISREDADKFAFESHQKAVAAAVAGHFDEEIVTVTTAKGEDVSTDEGPRAESTFEVLQKLRPIVQENGVVTAGNSSSLNDGASAIIVASQVAIDRWGLNPRAKVVASAVVGVEPDIMGIGPVPATEKALAKVGWNLDSIGSIELNEAFAAQALACMRRLGMNPEVVNRDGGAIALGHPLGSSGARIVVTLLGRMEREGSERGLATMCVGVGQGAALLVEKV